MKWRWSIRWTILNFRAQFKVVLIHAGREDCVSSEQDHPEFLLQEKGQSAGTESSERRSVPSRKTDRLHDLRLVSGYWRS